MSYHTTIFVYVCTYTSIYANMCVGKCMKIKKMREIRMMKRKKRDIKHRHIFFLLSLFHSFPFSLLYSCHYDREEDFFVAFYLAEWKDPGMKLYTFFFSSLSSLFIPLLFCLPVMQPDSGNFPLFVDFLKGKGGAGLKWRRENKTRLF